MGETALADGIAAFKQGVSRSSNPCDPSSEAWMCWRDGWEQARALADHIVQGTAGRVVEVAMASRQHAADA